MCIAISSSSVTAWLLVTREKGIAESPGASRRWAVDHLIVDQDAVPTLVEVKLAENSEIRRTIVGQMLEYAAHAAATWTKEELRRSFEESSRDQRRDPDQVIGELLAPDEAADADRCWDAYELRRATAATQASREAVFLATCEPRHDQIRPLRGPTARCLPSAPCSVLNPRRIAVAATWSLRLTWPRGRSLREVESSSIGSHREPFIGLRGRPPAALRRRDHPQRSRFVGLWISQSAREVVEEPGQIDRALAAPRSGPAAPQ